MCSRTVEVENDIIYISFKNLMVECAEEDAEQLTQVHVVGRLVEAQPATIVQVHGELGGESLAEHFHRGRHFLK